MDTMDLKRKHVEFLQEQAAARASGQPGAPAPKKPKQAKPKSEKKKKYLAKKAKRHKILAKAKKAAAPKNKTWTPGSEDGSGDEDNEETDDGNAVAGPSKLPDPVTAPKAVLGEVNPNEVEGEELDEATERERRRLQKKEKRAMRDHEEKRKRKEEKRRLREAEERAKEKGKARAEAIVEGANQDGEADDPADAEDVEMEEPPMDGSAQNGGVDTPEEPPTTERPSSPPLLEAFPLPTSAPAPDPKLLSRQGLPAGLEHAQLVDQNLRIPVDDVESVVGGKTQKGVGERMASRLKEAGVTEFFAVQAALLPHLLALPLVPNPFRPLDDYLISAPTGSGKTLAYSIPVIKALENRKIVRLRALIVLPTRDLVVQVRETLESLAKGTGLVIGTATGQHSFAYEQNQLIAERDELLLGGSSKVDILIATPGRLIDHLTKTQNFTLQHLRFLIIDEADRLLNQSFHNWLQQVLSHTRPPVERIPVPEGFVRQPWDLVAGEWQAAYGLIDINNEFFRAPESICQKLLFSATLTRDPAAIASLQLRNPQYFIVQDGSDPTSSLSESFALPSTLSEKYLVVPPQLKPLNLVHLCHALGVSNGLVFTKSVESVGRLVALLNFFEESYAAKKRVVIRGYTAEMKPGERKAVLADFVAGKVHLLVCSDVIARGLDLPSVSNVISYDTPVDLRKYVHRVGRTARAGREGTAWTLVEKQEALHFKGMMRSAGREKSLKKVKVKEDELSGYKEAYGRAMERVKEVFVRQE